MKEVYHDNLFDRLFIWLFTRKIAKVLAMPVKLTGYDGFVDLSQQIIQGRNAAEQQEAVAAVLKSLVPAPVLYLIRTLFSPTQLVCELNAWFATVLFEWLVGPCEVKEVEIMGKNGESRKQKSGVHIRKCRYLESSGCVGTCVNLCKLPTQQFFTRDFGIPLTMIPNFEDLSCEMIFGQFPPPLETEAAYTQSCLANSCALAKRETNFCPQVRDNHRTPGFQKREI